MSKPEISFLFDCDNTLLDNDRVEADLRRHLTTRYGPHGRRYLKIFDRLRAELGYADPLGALQAYRRLADAHTGLLLMSSFLVDYPFHRRVYPASRKALAHANRVGAALIVSDGDAVFQPRKILRSGLWDAVDGRVAVFEHKETMLGAVRRLYPAQHYVLIDDRKKVLRAAKTALGDRLTTVAVMQGSLAHAPQNLRLAYTPDLTLDGIGQLARHGKEELIAAAQGRRRQA